MTRPDHLLTLLLTGLATIAQAQTAPPAKETKSASLTRSAEDGWVDVSGFIDQAYGFLPVLIPITEPAVGYGAALAAAFIDKPTGENQAGFGRPNLTVVGGLATENGTKGVMAGDLRHWLGDRLQTTVGVFKASVNLDFYGFGDDASLRDHPLRYNLEPLGGLARAKLRLGDTRAWVGLSYVAASTEVTFKAPEQWPQERGFGRTSRLGGLTPSLSFDSRDNIFTPNRGTFLECEFGVYREGLGGDSDFERNAGVVIQYVQLGPTVVLGLRGDAIASAGEVPFYMRPYIALRGAPAMRYQGDEVASAEAEVRWRCWRRFSAIAFLGTGAAWRASGWKGNKESIVTGGLGFRYELARKYGVHAGLDVAHGPDGQAIYVQFGSAWGRL